VTLEQEQECLVNKLMRKIEKLEAETNAKQNNLEQLRREKVELENTLEQEQEALVNRLWKRMDKLEAEKRQEKILLFKIIFLDFTFYIFLEIYNRKLKWGLVRIKKIINKLLFK
jgi:predicted nuclease with TOPRIM domain